MIVIRNVVALVLLMTFSLNSEAQCNIRVRLTMIDPAYCADGWSGMRVTVTKNGTAVAGLANITLANSCGPVDFNLDAISGDVIRVNRVANGTWPNDNRVEVINMSSGVVMQAAHLPPASPTLNTALTVAAGCPVPPPPSPMTITGVLVEQITDDIQDFNMCPNLASNRIRQVVRIRITASAGTPITVTQFQTAYNGSAPITGIDNTRIYWTGNGTAFSSSSFLQFGANTIPSASSYNINGGRDLIVGDNYFWIAYEINSTVQVGQNLDAIVSQFTAGGVNYTTSSTPALNTTNPAGSRLCVPCTTPCIQRLCLYDNSTFENGTAGGQVQVYVNDNLVGTWGPLVSSGEQAYLETWFSAPPGATIRVVQSIAGTQPNNMRYWLYSTVPFSISDGNAYNDMPISPSTITNSFNLMQPGYELWMYAHHVTPVAGTATTGGHTYIATCNPDVPIPLPVDILDFKIRLDQENVIYLEWETSSERNNDYFTVEKSNDGESWDFVAKVQGAGNSSSSLIYKTNDEQPYLGINYYRLFQTDFDGTTSYLGTRSAKVESKEKFTIAPNPANTLFSVFGDIKKCEVKILNSHGQSIDIIKNEISEGKLEILTDNIPSGVYFIQLVTINSIETKKL
jgi:hypothetical protein